MSDQHSAYYTPAPSHWPIVGSLALFLMGFGVANWIHEQTWGMVMFFAGVAVLIYMMIGWFGKVIHENNSGLYNLKVDMSFRWAMAWFIFSEVMFFAAFFGALFYARMWSVPLLGGEVHPMTNLLLWPDFSSVWPLLSNPDNVKFAGANDVIPAWGIPALNTLILLSSGITITWSHWGLKKNNRSSMLIGLALTVLLGALFLALQVHEYMEAYEHYGLTLGSGIYGSTFFLLTGFHGMHVTVGAIMLSIIFYRCYRGDFTKDRHFGFEAAAWYWHFVDVVWLFLFVTVYWL